MKVHLIQIVWHRSGDAKVNSPIMSVSFHPRKLLLATAAQDKTVKVSVMPPAVAASRRPRCRSGPCAAFPDRRCGG